jgi:hypothetical protein
VKRELSPFLQESLVPLVDMITMICHDTDMLHAQIKIGTWPEVREIAISVGDRVRHWSGSTGVVVDLVEETIWYEIGGDYASKHVNVIVQPDRRPRQRKDYPSARWDGITEVVKA